jgi:hypothetical protein
MAGAWATIIVVLPGCEGLRRRPAQVGSIARQSGTDTAVGVTTGRPPPMKRVRSAYGVCGAVASAPSPRSDVERVMLEQLVGRSPPFYAVQDEFVY